MIPETANIPCHNLSLKATGVDDSAMARVGEKHRMEGGKRRRIGIRGVQYGGSGCGTQSNTESGIIEVEREREREREVVS